MSHNEPTHLDLFSGIGGFALAAQWAGFRTIAFCEIDKYCQRVLAKNFLSNTDCERRESARQECYASPNGERPWQGDACEFDNSRPVIHANIFDFDGTAYRGVSLLTGGFPCQPFSVAGKRGGAADDRAIWPEMFRIINEARPAWVLGENVPGIISMELDNVLSDLEGIGYACRPFVIPACAVDARHRRDRLWIVGRDVAHGRGKRLQVSTRSRLRSIPSENGSSARSQSCRGNAEARRSWLPEPDVGRVAHGVPYRVDRLRGLGNAIVPQVAYEILKAIREML